MSKIWLVSSTNDEILNADYVTNIYEKDGQVRACLSRPGLEPLEVVLKVNTLKFVRDVLQLSDVRVM